MKLLLFKNEKYIDLHLQFKELMQTHILLTQQIESHQLLQDDSLMKMIFELEIKHGRFDVFIIPVSIGDVHTEYLGLKLGLLIRLAFENENICTKPIIFISTESKAELINYSSLSTVFNFSETSLCSFNEFEIQDQILSIKSIPVNKIASELEKINIEKPIETNRHSLANDWAIYRLADVFNILDKIEASQNFKSKVNTSYFRLLLNKVHYKKSKGIKKIASGLQPSDQGKFLLIDDKASTGWSEVMRHLLQRMNPNNELEAIDSVKKKEDGQIDIGPILQIISETHYDLIFLDLRLLDEENSLNLNNISRINDFSGSIILNAIKDQDPSIPIIMFTASQQAWNYVQLLELGADGYFIKESPNNIFSDDILYQNISDLSIEISGLSKKGKILNWFFKNSASLKLKLKDLNWNSVLRQRLEEKLDIAFSLMLTKQNRIQKKFLYTDFEIAFLVYWSCLNEFHEQKIGKYSGEETFDMRCHLNLIKDSNTSIQYIPSRDNPSIQTLEWKNRFPDGRKMPNIILRISPHKIGEEQKKHLKNISNLIPAYILLRYGSSKQDLVNHFCIMNEIRNKLDFTHSDETIISKMNIEMARNENQAIEDCKNMFKLIYFLLTEIELL